MEKKRERGRGGKSGLIINEEWREVHDDSYFKLMFDKNKKELKSGQLGSNEELKKKKKKKQRKADKGKIHAWKAMLGNDLVCLGARLGAGVP